MNYLVFKVIYANANVVIGEHNFIGYQIRVPKDYELEVNKFCKLYLYEYASIMPNKNLIIKDLYGFRTYNERLLFIDLISINSIGPKTAINILKYDINLIIDAIATKDVDFLATIKGVNQRSANLICDQLNYKYINKVSEKNPWAKELSIGLENLGYDKKDIEYAITKVKVDTQQNIDISEIIGCAIKEISLRHEN
ncbi:Holliday junction branch migration protein RuvA [Ureaplasma urealyticum]|uniref:Holliday junction branch migration complex subunit RuvA n=3 Tax=Ureaplasma urealyticum TaxID=2130 RepID=RUVA_UREU1|nr:Holliday junction branch migration protein RuvA [Ureaplasma urealyticum]B5ZBT6.1 RecName: Full=Holliday junction branch migration complex subunit RuvA [Ureaplasma urealyticum serovar 10 str. ATCC 33699]EDX53749.1 holliday junction ATP-dependent DNA helicase RuvA [Ureaplasma urealyticum serovar 9 str. ATCC 33175]ACI60096.1 holliday junction ATP-dependent DNA helicase RuvA [Ureaplasma urealyticum serovar 10 str. ATCC 33699]EDT49458.1 holliday junction ATP-dependent DNA helicase RuvA [Ureaplasm